MHPFSVDFLTSACVKKEMRITSPSQLSTSSGIRTPSPNSSLSSNSSPQTSVNDPDVAKALIALERQAARKPAAGLEKPPLSYIALISMAILSSPGRKLLLSDIYQWIMDNFEYYNNGQKAWRNSVRHNLSLNECFIKNGRSENGKGHFWAIHAACVEDFSNGDYRRRQARRRAKRNNLQEVQNTQPVIGYMHASPAMRFSPYAMPMHMYTQMHTQMHAQMHAQMPYYAAPMSPLTPELAAMPTMAPLSPHPAYPSFPMSAAMMTPFPLSHASFQPW